MVPEEVRRARQLRCSQCGRTGAAMGCDVADCECTYHLPCVMLQVGREGADSGCLLALPLVLVQAPH